MLDTLCDAPLDGTGSLRLRQVGAGERLNELEFYFPLTALSKEVFMGVCRTISPAAPDEWTTRMEDLAFDDPTVEEYLKRWRTPPAEA